MIYTLKNEQIKAEFIDVGAELRSLKTADGAEYLWQGDAKYWSGRAPNLFPVVGRLTDNSYTYQGKTYEMSLHGFARKSVFAAVEKTDSRVAFELRESKETLKSYPFKFRFTVTYAINGNTLETIYGVENTEKKKEIIFAVGGHPAFNVPVGGEAGRRFDEYYLQFSGGDATEILMSQSCYLTKATRAFPLYAGRLHLKHGLFDNDALVLANMPPQAAIKSDNSARSVTVDYPDMKYLGLWHKPQSDAPYICIEPWASVPAYEGVIDDLETKRDMVRLPAGGKYETGFYITII